MRKEIADITDPIIEDQDKIWKENLLVPNLIGIFDPSESKKSTI